MDDKRPESLRHRHEFDRVDVDARRQRCDPMDRLGDVLRRQRVRPLVELGRLCPVASKSHRGEFRASGKTRLNIGDSDLGPEQVGAQIERELWTNALVAPYRLPPG